MAALVVACVLPVWLVAGVLIGHAYHAKRVGQEDQMQDTARALAETVDRDIAIIGAALRALATSPSLAAGDLAAFHAQAKVVARDYEGISIVLSDPDALQIVNTLFPYGAPLRRRSVPDAVRQVFRTGKPVIADLWTGPVTNRPQFGVEIPIFRDGQVIYDLGMNVPAERLQTVLSSQHFPPGSLAEVIDAAGSVITRMPNPEPYVGRKERQNLIDRMSRENNGIEQITSFEGVPFTAAFSRSNNSRWGVVVGLPTASMAGEIVGWLWLTILGSTVLSTLGIALALRIGLRIARAIATLGASAAAVGQGPAVEIRPVGVAEIDDVALALIKASRLIRQREGERDQAEHDLRVAKEDAEQANRAKSRFLAMMSHELRTPLNVVVGFTELLQGDEANPKRREQLDMIRQAAHSLLRLIEDILDLSRIEAGKISIDIADFDLTQELHEIGSLFRPDATAKGLALDISIAPALPVLLRGDVGLLRSVLNNLVSNAIKFTDAGRIEVKVGQAGVVADDDRRLAIAFHVSDTGIGIKPNNHARIFEMFEQEDASLARRYNGSGLGLAISKKLVSVLGGQIWVQSEPNVGSCFSFTAEFEIGGPAAAAPPLAPASGDLTVRRNPHRVLLVEDDPPSRKVLSQILVQAGFYVATAGDGAKALALYERSDFDLIVMDLHLPIMDGVEAVRRIRSGTVAGRNAAIPIIAVTAYALRGDRERFLGYGVTDYIAKPIDMAQLMNAIDGVLCGGDAAQPGRLRTAAPDRCP